MLRSSLYIMFSKLIGYGIRLVLPYFLVRLMTVADFGAYRQFFLLEVYVGTLFQLGLNQALYYFIPRDPRNAGAYFINSILMNLVVFGVAFLGIGMFAAPLGEWLNMAILRDAFWYLTGHTILVMLTTACDCFLMARQQIRASAVFEISGQVLASIGTVAAAWATRRLDAVLLALVVARGIQLAAMLIHIHWRLKGFAAERYFAGLREQLRYGVALGLAGTFGSLLMRLHDFFVSRYYGTETYAIYSVGCTEIPVVQIFTQSLAVVALGQFANLEKQQDWAGIRDLWSRVLASTYAVTIPTVIVLLLVARPLVIIMFTDAYADAVPIFRANTVLKLHLLFNATLVLRAMNRNDVSIWVNGAVLLAAPMLLYGGMKAWGLVGIITAQAVLMVASRVIPVMVLNRLAPVRLAYAAPWREVTGFYRQSARAVADRLPWRSSGGAGSR